VVRAAEREKDESIEYHFWETMTYLVRKKEAEDETASWGFFLKGYAL